MHLENNLRIKVKKKIIKINKNKKMLVKKNQKN